MRGVSLLSLFSRWENWGTEMLTNLFKDTKIKTVGGRIWMHPVLPQYHAFNHFTIQWLCNILDFQPSAIFMVKLNYGSFRVYIFFSAVPYSLQPQNSARKITFSHIPFDLSLILAHNRLPYAFLPQGLLQNLGNLLRLIQEQPADLKMFTLPEAAFIQRQWGLMGRCHYP